MNTYKKAGSFRSVTELRDYLASNKIDIPLADEPVHDALSQPVSLFGRTLPNRWAILPMEGWDCTAAGAPSDLTVRRWRHFATSGAALVCGTEAGAVTHAGRSNPYQLLVSRENLPELKTAVAAMRRDHAERFGTGGDFLIGLQLTHSGRFAHPNRSDVLESAVAWTHPLLDRKFGKPRVVTDKEVGEIVAAYGEAARVAREAGFDFVDLKHAHGYLAHDFLSAHGRPGPYGGSFENRTRFSREIASRVKEACPYLPLAMRLSFFDILPFEKGPDGVGRPMGMAVESSKLKVESSGPKPSSLISHLSSPGSTPEFSIFHSPFSIPPVPHSNTPLPTPPLPTPPLPFGAAPDCLSMDPDLAEPVAFLEMMRAYGIDLVCGTIGSPYYCVHIQRPAYFPVSDGYLPPQDPLLSVSLHLAAARRIKERCPWAKIVLSGLTCLQEYAGCAAEAAIRDGAADFAGLGRMALPYADYCADHLAGGNFDRRRICRTFGDCTNAPRRGEVSGCYPLDAFYKTLEKVRH